MIAGGFHATENLDISLTNAKKLLADNGILLLAEQTNAPDYFDVIFGVLDGWWLFNDKWRTNRALIDQDKWKQVLEINNYTDIQFLSDNAENSVHSLILAINSSPQKDIVNTQFYTPSKELQDRQWLVLMKNNSDLYEGIFDALASHNIQPIKVSLADKFIQHNKDSYSIDANNSDDFKKIVSLLNSSPIIINTAYANKFQ